MTQATTGLPHGWREAKGRLVCGYRFRDFVHAMKFLNDVAEVAERHEHHPDFAVHWNEVRFEAWSHDANAVTDRDHRLVGEIARLAERHGARLVAPP